MDGQNLLQIFGNGKVTKPDHISGALYQPGISKVKRQQTKNLTHDIFILSACRPFGFRWPSSEMAVGHTSDFFFFNSMAEDPNFTLGHTYAGLFIEWLSEIQVFFDPMFFPTRVNHL